MSHCVRKFYELNFRAYYCGKVQLPKLLRPRQYARIREKAAVTRLMLGNQKPGGFYEVWTTLVSGLGFFSPKSDRSSRRSRTSGGFTEHLNKWKEENANTWHNAPSHQWGWVFFWATNTTNSWNIVSTVHSSRFYSKMTCLPPSLNQMTPLFTKLTKKNSKKDSAYLSKPPLATWQISRFCLHTQVARTIDDIFSSRLDG